MSRIFKPLLTCLLITVVFSQTVNLSAIFTPATQATLGPEYQDPAFLTLINNYFGCKTWTEGLCTQCSADYIFNKNGVCCVIDPNCQNFNRDMGICELCYTGYSVSSNGSCTQVALSTNDSTVGCAQWNNNVCQKCSVRYYMQVTTNICQPVSGFCRDWNTTTGACIDCYPGYSLSNVSCILDQVPPSTVASNPNCKTWNGTVCQACADRAYFDANLICQLVNPQCWTWDSFDGICLSCYSGYDLENGTCVFSPSNNALVSDPGCKTWSNSLCLECSARWVFSNAGICIPVSDTCRTNDLNGVCLTCYSGYTLLNGSCEYSQSNSKVPDAGCGNWNWQNLTCTSCSKDWVFNDNGICVQVQDTCRTYDTNGVCTGCFLGYALTNGSCLYSNNYQSVSDQGCKIWNWNNNFCSQCSAWWYLNSTSGTCQQVSDLCQAYSADGLCTDCYKGYDLKSGVCVVSPIAAPSDLGCKTWNQSVCVQCSANWVINLKNVCVAVSDQCKTFDSNGNCLSCYVGYEVVNGSCLFKAETVSDIGCSQWDWTNQICKACSSNYVFDSNENCVSVSDQCKTYDNVTGFCISCYKGYDLINITSVTGQLTGIICNISASDNIGPSDLGCKLWNWDNQTCIKCSQGWYLNSSNYCAEISPYCKSSDLATGLCLSCYSGYDLINGTCIYSPLNTAAPPDPGCKTWRNGLCIQCSNDWTFNQNNICTPVSDLCKTSSGQLCTSCFNGYVLVNGTCQLSPLNSIIPTDAGCSNWDWNAQKCLQCSHYWYFNNSVCTPVSDLCKTYDNVTGLCLSCFKGYALADGACSIHNQTLSDVGCSQWNWDNNTCLNCSNYWYMNEGVCTAVSAYCKTYDSTTGACTSCFSGYGLSNGSCSVSVNVCKSSDSSGCLSCYNGFALYNKSCISLDNIANIALYYAECCPQKLAQLQAEGRIPQ